MPHLNSGLMVSSSARGLNLIVYTKPSTWMPLVSGFLKPQLRRGALTRWRRQDFDHLYDDDPEWLNTLNSGLKTSYDRVEEDFSCALKAWKVLTFHACRPKDLEGYFANGIVALDSSALMQLLNDAIGELHIPEIRAELLTTGQANLNQHTYSVAYVVLDQRNLLRHAGHYLIYGSEWLCSVFGRHQSLLRHRGVPTLLEVAFPLTRASDGDRRQLARHLLHEWTRLTALNPDGPQLVDFSFAVRGGIPSEMIVGHSHPSLILDPLDGSREYVNEKTICRHCMVV